MAHFRRQTTIWSQLERELPPGLEEVQEFVAAISEFDEELVEALEKDRGHGRNDHPVRAMWNLVMTSLYLRNGRFSEMLGELYRNSDLARLLGFEEIAPNRYRLPSKSSVSRFHSKLKEEEWLAKVREVFEQTVAALAEADPEFGRHTALDATDIRTHARPGTKAREGSEGTKQGRPSSDPEASWSVKTKRWEDGQGRQREEKKATFGYKGYVVTDTRIPGIVAVKVETGKTCDQSMVEPMIEAVQAVLEEARMETMAMDKGFDSEETVRAAVARGVQPIVPVREVPVALDSLPREDREEPLTPGGNIVYDRYTGEVACYEKAGGSGEATRRTMKYAGFEADRSAHKFRCPLGPAAATECRAFNCCSAGRCGTQGRQVRVRMSTDVRRFAPVYPRSKRWQRLYNGRSAVERINGYLKGPLQLENHAVRGKNAIELRLLIASITLNGRTLISLRRQAAARQAA